VAANYSVDNINMGGDLRRNHVNNGHRRTDMSFSYNLGVRLRDDATLNLSYGMNQREVFNGLAPDMRLTRTQTLNVQGRIRPSRRGQLTMTYGHVFYDESGDESNNLAVSYKQDF
jgi:hypothetical protein